MRDSSTRNFNTAGPVRGGYDRGRNNRNKNFLTVAILAVMVAIIVLTVLIILEIADCGGKRPDDSDGPEINSVFGEVTFEDKLYSSMDVNTGDLILINASFPYVFPAETPEFQSSRDSRTPLGTSDKGYTIYSYYTQNAATCAKLEANMLKAFNAMTDDFYRATGNIDLFIYDEDGYRSYDDQAAKYSKKPTEYAPAGQSEHHTGKCVDLYVNVSSNEPVYKMDDARFNGVYQWIYDNAYKYGFILRYSADKASITGVTYEPYHFRYVGYPHAYYMDKNNICLEEYLDYVRDHHTKSSPLYVTGDNGNSYMIYYVPASSENLTTVSVPEAGNEGVSYTVSGDNKAGFIVTVEKNNG